MGLWKLIYPAYGTCPIHFRAMHNDLVRVLERWQTRRKGKGKKNKSNSKTEKTLSHTAGKGIRSETSQHYSSVKIHIWESRDTNLEP